MALAAFLVALSIAQSGAPHLEVKGGGILPLEEARGDVSISGVIARVRVTQVWKNDGSNPIEATYIFPASTRAAVFGMRMKIGARTIEAKIAERDEARSTYEKAKRTGQTASLLEEHRANIFEMNVANIMPGDRIETVLDYTELLVPEDGVYAFVYPTVVGPRYSANAAADAAATGTASTLTPAFPFRLSAKIAAGMRIAEVTSTTHEIAPRVLDNGVVRVDVDDEHGGDRDFVLQYRLQGSAIETGMMLYPGARGDENYFLLMMQPPDRIEPRAIPPREYVFIIDVSGSMGGFPLEIAKRTLRTLIEGLKPSDRFNVMTFAGTSSVLGEESVYATSDNVDRAIEVLEHLAGGGGTELVPALKRALEMPRDKEMATSFVVITDGFVTVEPEVFSLVRSNLGTANMFAFGIGSSVNRLLIEGIARAGMGHPYIVEREEDASREAERLLKALASPILTDVSVRFDGFDAYDVEPAAQPSLFAARPIVVFGKYRGTPHGVAHVRGVNGEGVFERAMNIADFVPSDDHSGLRWLWARDRIGRLSDLDARAEIVRLGLKYSLLTEHTSFVAVDSLVRNTRAAELEKIEQPVPLPRGVSACELGGGFYRPPRAHGGDNDGASGESVGAGGLGLSGIGTGGGGSGSGYGLGRGGLRGRGERAPAIIAAQPNAVLGSLSAQDIRDVMKRNLARLKYCYEKELPRSPNLAGRIAFRFIIDPSGHVSFAELSERLGNEPVEQCMLNVIRALVFPRPNGGGIIEVHYPLNVDAT